MLPFADMWRPLLGTLALLSIAIALLSFRLGTLTPNLSQPEVESRTASRSVRTMASNPLHIHQKTGQYLMQKAGQTHPAAMRLPSVIVALAVVVAMYALLKLWYTRRIALLGSLLVITSSWFLHAARLAAPDINYMIPFVFAIGAVLLVKKRLSLIGSVLLAFFAATLIYVPGMIWLLLAGILWQRRTIKHSIKRLTLQWRASLGIACLLCLLPLVWAFSQHPNLILTWLGLPETIPSFTAYVRNFIDIPIRLFIKNEVNPVYGLGQLPLLDAFTGAMTVLGLFASYFRLRLERTKLVLGAGVIGSILVALGGPVSMTILLPSVYILAASGVALMIQQWLTVFPRNPFARWLGIVLVTTAVCMTGFYQGSRYFIAWAKAPETRAVFEHQ
jgi:hypothetical protein